MRLENFNPLPTEEPLGEGDENRVFIHPRNEEQVISVRKENVEQEKDTLRQLKARYYLTKIVHLLLPKNIPDIYQAGESLDGTQTIDRKRVAHTPGHSRLQELRRGGISQQDVSRKEKEEEQLTNQLERELKGMKTLDDNLEKIGVSESMEENYSNYTKDRKNVQYLESFKPWQANLAKPGEIELLFDETILRKNILKITDEPTRGRCEHFLERILTLFGEERKELQKRELEQQEENRKRFEMGEFDAKIKEIETLLAEHMSSELLERLNSIQTKEEAGVGEERKKAIEIRGRVFENLQHIKEYIPVEKYRELWEKYRKFSAAIGVVKYDDTIDHSLR